MDVYAESYGDLSVHRTMLGDGPRMRAYCEAIEKAGEYLKDSLVLDVGCGTGILSLWCALKSEARLVIGVEANAVMAERARTLVRHHKLEERVLIVEGKVEDLSEVLKEYEGKVDVVLSEWMGHYLLHESMLDSVLYARDKYLRRTTRESDGSALGLMMPAKASIYAEISYMSPMDQVEWADPTLLSGVDISPIFPPTAVSTGSGEPVLCHIHSRPPWCQESLILSLDLYTVRSEDLDQVRSEHSVTFKASGVANCVAIGFTCEFSPTDVTLDTRSGAPKTHWKQTILPLGGEYPIEAGMTLSYNIIIERKTREERSYEIDFEVV